MCEGRAADTLTRPLSSPHVHHSISNGQKVRYLSSHSSTSSSPLALSAVWARPTNGSRQGAEKVSERFLSLYRSEIFPEKKTGELFIQHQAKSPAAWLPTPHLHLFINENEHAFF